MKTKIFLFALCFPIICFSQGNNDSTVIKNKLMIEELKNRINTIGNIGNGSNTFQKQIDELKVEMTRQNDSIVKLLNIINELKKYAPSNNPNSTRKNSIALNSEKEMLLDTKSLKDNDYNSLKKSDNAIQSYVMSCNCSPLFYKPYQVELNFKTITDLNEIIKSYELNSSRKIVISGHADKSGSESKNIMLSKQRAENLKNYLVIASDKIKKEDIIIEWHGSSNPIPNLPETKNELNRRTEISLK